MPENAVVKSGRREALFALGLWLAAGIYTVVYCTQHGYDLAPADITYILWFPAWVFWGIVVPWLACAAISTWFALAVMSDEPLSSDLDSPPEDGPPVAASPGAGPSSTGPIETDNPRAGDGP
jgi:hypothetical protein